MPRRGDALTTKLTQMQNFENMPRRGGALAKSLLTITTINDWRCGSRLTITTIND